MKYPVDYCRDHFGRYHAVIFRQHAGDSDDLYRARRTLAIPLDVIGDPLSIPMMAWGCSDTDSFYDRFLLEYNDVGRFSLVFEDGEILTIDELTPELGVAIARTVADRHIDMRPSEVSVLLEEEEDSCWVFTSGYVDRDRLIINSYDVSIADYLSALGMEEGNSDLSE